jgi:hypothetical protein
MSDESERKDGMMTLEQVVEWFEGLAAAELDAEVAARSHPDEQRGRRGEARRQPLLLRPHGADLLSRAGLSSCAVGGRREAAGTASPGAGGEREAVGGGGSLGGRDHVHERGEPEPVRRLLRPGRPAARAPGDRRYHVCSACHRTGKARGRACGECQGGACAGAVARSCRRTATCSASSASSKRKLPADGEARRLFDARHGWMAGEAQGAKPARPAAILVGDRRTGPVGCAASKRPR